MATDLFKDYTCTFLVGFTGSGHGGELILSGSVRVLKRSAGGECTECFSLRFLLFSKAGILPFKGRETIMNF